MNENLNVKILESYVEIDKLHDNITNKIFEFITKASSFVELSEDDYQIEKSIILNKISLKDYVLNSECCRSLNNKNVSNYSVDELKNYLHQYDIQNNTDSSVYYEGLSLYELLEKIESLVDKKINLEISELSRLINSLDTIKTIEKSDYEKYYFDFKSNIDSLKEQNKLDEKSYGICIQILNDIFNFYINDYPSIPDKYLENSHY